MRDFIDNVKKRSSQFSIALQEKDHSIDYYTPHFYERLAKDLKNKGITLSDEAAAELTSRRSLHYIANVNCVHRMIHQMHSHDEIEINPREKRYHDLQYAESLSTLLVRMADDIVDNSSIENRKTTLAQVRDYINSIVFHTSDSAPDLNINAPIKESLSAVATCLHDQLEALHATGKYKQVVDNIASAWNEEMSCSNMKEYREARKKISVESANLGLFFILGGGDQIYQDRYFHDSSRMQQITQLITVSANYIDSYVDFEKDKNGATNNLSPQLPDKIWFLSAGVKELIQCFGQLDSKQATYFSALSANALSHTTRKHFNDTYNQEYENRYEEIKARAMQQLTGHSDISPIIN